MTTTIERSPGIALPTGHVAGGGRSGATPELDAHVAAAAEALGKHFDGPVAIRFNSDRRSGGAWLRTSEQDAIGRNAHVGISAGIDHETGAINTWVRLSPLATGHDGMGGAVESISDAVDFIRDHCDGSAADLIERERIAVAAWRETHLRRAMVTSAIHDGRRVSLIVFGAADAPEAMATIRRSRTANASNFPSYMLDGLVAIDDGVVMPRSMGITRLSKTPWRTALDVREGVLYRVYENGTADDMGPVLARKGAKR